MTQPATDSGSPDPGILQPKRELTSRTYAQLRRMVHRRRFREPPPASELAPNRLHFVDPTVEGAFREAFNAASVRHLRYGAAFTALLTALSGIIEAMFHPIADGDARVMALRFGVAVPCLVLTCALTWWPAAMRRIEWVTLGCILAIAFGYSLPALVWSPPGIGPSLLYQFALVLGAAYLAARLRFGWALAAGAGVLVAFAVAAWLVPPPPDQTILVVYFMAVSNALYAFAVWQLERSLRRNFLDARLLDAERNKAEELLLNILPRSIADRLKSEDRAIADGFEATVLFSDLVGFTEMSAHMTPGEVVALLDDVVSMFDDLATHHGLEKIKTIGDAYMVAGGVPDANANHAVAVASMALDMVDSVAMFNRTRGRTLRIRVGIDTGPVVAGVIGKSKFIYDLWGDTVNTASRMESHGMPGCIQVTESACRALQHAFVLEPRGAVQVKGKGEMATWMLMGRIAQVGQAS